ncbi:D-alanyl-D-alanine carboxypeptidase [Sphingomonas sp. XMGL2]|uniref:D-alanyl-D-alanine carboxypeptidase n=2 Tax=Sphingomonas quercus TaxID=2842451 RepID=A0ABS6BH41_9SPHN|nr:D-alanyl-D-alanine carboxypeptidase [Sphingomonas quercus]
MAPAAGLTPIIQPRYAAIVMDASTREVLYANAADEIRHPASITKVMTLFLTFDALRSGRLQLDDQVPISRHAAAQRPSKLGLPAGRSISVREAIEVVAVKSANDIAVALAEKIAGSEPAFARMMTNKARMLGMKATYFSNASGLNDVANFTTARDLAILSASILAAHPDRYSYFGMRTASFGKLRFANHNPLLGKLDGVDGIKTGFTNDAGYTQAASAVRGGRRLITVVMGEPTIAARSRDLTALLDAGFSVLEKRARGQLTTVAANLPDISHPALRIMPGHAEGSAEY